MSELAYGLDTFYFVVSGVLVMWMAAGFTMLEAGMVRSKNSAEIVVKNFSLFAIACVAYLVVGYNIMYGEGLSTLIPGATFFVEGDNAAVTEEAYYSGMSDFFFQIMFVATAMSVISGAVAERMKLSSFLLFAIPMCAVIYPVVGYWTWGGGFLSELGYSDFAGSGIVHLTGAVAALVGAFLIGARKGKYDKNGKARALPGSNLMLVGLGTWILWMGWFGFNGGSQLAISSLENANAVAKVVVNTNLAACGGLIVSLLISKLRTRRTDLTIVLNGALAGLVAITASPLAPSPIVATLIGGIGGLVCYASVLFFEKIRIDDPVGAISVHGSAGIAGVMLVPLTSPEVTFIAQATGVGVIVAFVGVVSTVCFLGISAFNRLRVSEEEEFEGSDLVECGITSYPEFSTSAR